MLSIYAELCPLFKSDHRLEDPLYKILEIHMQRVGCLLAYREELNWDQYIEMIELGDEETLKKLKKVAAKNDGVPLIYAQLTKNTVYEHLIVHPNNEGIYLPFDFNGPFPIKHENKKLWLGSAVRLKEELKWLEITMQHQPDDILSYWNKFRDTLNVAIEHKSPLIFTNKNPE